MKVSLIIPVYNKAPFLRRCLDSVAKQYNKNLVQVVLVDDGSTDGSGVVCVDYQIKYGWEFYKTLNWGVSSARNFGMKQAKGDYIAFLDADDVLMSGAIQDMVREARKGRNITQFGHYRCRNYNELNLLAKYRAPAGDYGFDYIPKYWVMVWNKLYKRSFLESNGITFEEGMQFGEDTLFNARCILANGGFYYSDAVTMVHCLDDNNSLCRGDGMSLEKVILLDKKLCELADKQTETAKIDWMNRAINEHRNSKFYRRLGFNHGNRGRYDVVYFLKDTPENDELVYSLRSLEENWAYRQVWFCGGHPLNLRPDLTIPLSQTEPNKWAKVRSMLKKVCENDEITEDFWLFNDDFYVLKPMTEDIPPQYNGEILSYVTKVERKIGGPDGFTERLRYADNDLRRASKTTLNYEVHKPMLINRKKALEVMEKFPNTPAFRSLYGNYWQIGGDNQHDRKIKVLNYSKIDQVRAFWDFLSTSDESFRDGNIGQFVRERFPKKSRFEI